MSLLFRVVFEHWQAAELAAERAWLNVWRKVDARARGIGPSPGETEMADAFLLRREAHELLQALRRQLSEEGEQVHLLHRPEGTPRGGGDSKG